MSAVIKPDETPTLRFVRAKGGEAETWQDARLCNVPDLWHVAHHFPEGSRARAAVLDAWHLAHDLQRAVSLLAEILPGAMSRAVDRLAELIEDLRDGGDDSAPEYLREWADEIDELCRVFERFRFDEWTQINVQAVARDATTDARKLADDLGREFTAPNEANEDDESESLYLNRYECPECGHKWADTWSAMCDDDCSACGERHISPYTSEDVEL